MVTFPQSGYIHFLERVLTPSRLQHSLGVMQVMGKLAPIYALDLNQALTAGLLHDAAKDLPTDQIEALVAEAGIEFQYPCERDLLYLHGPVGAFYVQKELGITDPAVLDAIIRHTWVRKIEGFESPLVWCLRFADVLEPNRHYDTAARVLRDGCPHLREVAYAGNLEEAALLDTRLIIEFFKDAGKPIHPNRYQIYNEILNRVNRKS